MKKLVILIPLLLICVNLYSITNDEKKLINKLINTMATQSTAYLIYHRKDLRELGDKIQHLSPIVFFTHVLDSLHRKKQLQIILSSYFTRTEFIGEATINLNNYNQNMLIDELEEFSIKINKDYDCLNYFAKKRDWKNFVFYIAS